MTRRLIPLAAALVLAGCGANSAATVVASYTLAASAAADYEATLPAASPQKAIIKACENVAWSGVKPVSDALMGGTDPSSAAINGALGAVTNLNGCLSVAGVKTGGK